MLSDSMFLSEGVFSATCSNYIVFEFPIPNAPQPHLRRDFRPVCAAEVIDELRQRVAQKIEPVRVDH